MKWHDCKLNPPKKDGQYLVYVEDYDGDFGGHFGVVFYFADWCGSPFFMRMGGRRPGAKLKKQPVKWAEINLDEEKD